MIAPLGTGYLAGFFMAYGGIGAYERCRGVTSCEEAAWNAFLAGVWVLVGSFVVAVALAIWRRRSRLLYLALLGYLLAGWLAHLVTGTVVLVVVVVLLGYLPGSRAGVPNRVRSRFPA